MWDDARAILWYLAEKQVCQRREQAQGGVSDTVVGWERDRHQ